MKKTINIFLVLVMLVCSPLLLFACQKPQVDEERLLKGVDIAVRYFENDGVVDLSDVNESWFEYDGVNYYHSTYQGFDISKEDNLLYQGQYWFINNYKKSYINTTQKYNDLYIRVWNENVDDYITLFRDYGTYAEGMVIKKQDSSPNYTYVTYVKCDTQFEICNLMIQDDLKMQWETRWFIDFDYETLKNTKIKNFDIKKYQLLKYEEVHAFHDENDEDNRISYKYVFRKDIDEYYEYHFYVDYNQKSFFENQRTDELTLLFANSYVVNNFMDIYLDYLR